MGPRIESLFGGSADEPKITIAKFAQKAGSCPSDIAKRIKKILDATLFSNDLHGDVLEAICAHQQQSQTQVEPSEPPQLRRPAYTHIPTNKLVVQYNMQAGCLAIEFCRFARKRWEENTFFSTLLSPAFPATTSAEAWDGIIHSGVPHQRPPAGEKQSAATGVHRMR
ncbi:hypothetical protein RP20_CCG011325 [Aedes albopictus]|nr:hypothetical protein RP20_CCG011325 [Aedes albopictus]